MVFIYDARVMTSSFEIPIFEGKEYYAARIRALCLYIFGHPCGKNTHQSTFSGFSVTPNHLIPSSPHRWSCHQTPNSSKLTWTYKYCVVYSLYIYMYIPINRCSPTSAKLATILAARNSLMLKFTSSNATAWVVEHESFNMLDIPMRFGRGWCWCETLKSELQLVGDYGMIWYLNNIK